MSRADEIKKIIEYHEDHHSGISVIHSPDALAQALADSEAERVKPILKALKGLFDVAISRHPHAKLFKEQLESGELSRRLITIGPAFSPDGFVQAILTAQQAIKKVAEVSHE